MAVEQKLYYTLRAHVASITDLCCVYGLNTPHLLSSDSDGTIYLWNLISRRPVAHGKISGQVVWIDCLRPGLYVALSKDNTLRFMRTQHNKEIVKITEYVSRELQELRVVYEIPVNSLNFANVAIQELDNERYMLWCCNTMDSECIDIYEFNLSNEQSFKRVFQALNIYEQISNIRGEKNIFKFDKLGTIMKFLAVGPMVYCGFESGFVVGLRVCDGVVDIAYVSPVHYPEPVLGMVYNKEKHVVLTSSTKNIIGIHCTEMGFGKLYDKIDNVRIMRGLEYTKTSFNVPLKKVSHIDVLDGLLLLGSWTGYVVALQESDNEVVFKIRKDKNQVYVDDSYIGNAEPSNKEKPWTPVGCVIGVPGNVFDKLGNRNSLRPGEIRKLNEFAKHRWCVVGYEDGTITIYQV
ncbi:HBL108Cp [Eremothecium sinecaudum]|uniref:HBL108Cp n=1 Tax=Eremothecium sinecaudum TaxID=45286 RepID=A0A120K0X5_9SACH|nr:HBL108Cp [Eremothecium sinecaudum]AMD18794.1 HBL108Cp [Eremothecium sinecaudum]